MYCTYLGDNADCQNYVSQCLWAGFGGNQGVPAYQQYPMDSIWWTTHYNCSNQWSSASNFYNYVTGNQNNNTNGVQGTDWGTVTNYMQPGDYVYDVNMGHVYFMTGCDDSKGSLSGVAEWPEIIISAHNENHIDHYLQTLYWGGIIPSNMKFMRIYRIVY